MDRQPGPVGLPAKSPYITALDFLYGVTSKLKYTLSPYEQVEKLQTDIETVNKRLTPQMIRQSCKAVILF